MRGENERRNETGYDDEIIVKIPTKKKSRRVFKMPNRRIRTSECCKSPKIGA